MRLVGLTGGIGTGKSTVSNLLNSHGIPIVDADLVARDVLKKGTGGWKKVVAAFGEDILQVNGEVDRPKLGEIVFSDPAKRQLLDRFQIFAFGFFRSNPNWCSSVGSLHWPSTDSTPRLKLITISPLQSRVYALYWFLTQLELDYNELVSYTLITVLKNT